VRQRVHLKATQAGINTEQVGDGVTTSPGKC
jgi:hypothetical protein